MDHDDLPPLCDDSARKTENTQNKLSTLSFASALHAPGGDQYSGGGSHQGEASQVGGSRAIKVRDVWVISANHSEMPSHHNNSFMQKGFHDMPSSDRESAFKAPEDDDEREHESAALGSWIANPSSKKRVMWDLFGMLLIMIDVVMIPFSLFDPPETTGTMVLSWVALLFWTADMPASLFVGYLDRGEIVMEFHRIVRRYLRTWFAIDCMVVVPDWVCTIVLMGNKDAGSGVQRLLRVLRIARCLRLIRLLKLKKLMSSLTDRIDSEYVFMMSDLLRLISIVILSSHIMACLMYAIGKATDPPDTWYQQFVGRKLLYKYFTALYWSLSKMVLESADIEAMNSLERIFSVFCLAIGLILFSSVVSRITGSMVQLEEMSRDDSKQFWRLRRYLSEHGVSRNLSIRIQRFVEHAMERQKEIIPEHSVKMLEHLSKHLTSELLQEICQHSLCSHLYFERMSENSEVTMQRICANTLSRSQLAAGDPLFFQHEQAESMFFVVSGELRYQLRNRAQKKSEEGVQTKRGAVAFHTRQHDIVVDDEDSQGDRAGLTFAINKRGSLCESALWILWFHLGPAWSARECELISISADMFGKVVSASPMIYHKTITYAARFADAVGKQSPEEHTDMSDFESLNLSRYLIPEAKKSMLHGGRVSMGSAAAALGKVARRTHIGTGWFARTKTGKHGTMASKDSTLSKVSEVSSSGHSPSVCSIAPTSSPAESSTQNESRSTCW